MNRHLIVNQIAETFGLPRTSLPCVAWVHLSEPEGIPSSAHGLADRMRRRGAGFLTDETIGNVLDNLQEHGFVTRDGTEWPASYIAVDPGAVKGSASVAVVGSSELSTQVKPEGEMPPWSPSHYNEVPYFPTYQTTVNKDSETGTYVTEVSSMLRLKCGGKWYVILVSERFMHINTPKDDMIMVSQLVIRLLKRGYEMSHTFSARIDERQLDTCQLDEVDRLSMLHKLRSGI